MDGDADASTVEWVVGGVVVGVGATFTGYGPGESITCRVTPSDGVGAGEPVTSAAVEAPDKIDVATSEFFACATKRGALSCWGDNGQGQLGDGTTIRALRPRWCRAWSAA